MQDSPKSKVEHPKKNMPPSSIHFLFHLLRFFPMMKPKIKENNGYIEKITPIIVWVKPRSKATFGKNIAGIPKVQKLKKVRKRREINKKILCFFMIAIQMASFRVNMLFFELVLIWLAQLKNNFELVLIWLLIFWTIH